MRWFTEGECMNMLQGKSLTEETSTECSIVFHEQKDRVTAIDWRSKRIQNEFHRLFNHIESGSTGNTRSLVYRIVCHVTSFINEFPTDSEEVLHIVDDVKTLCSQLITRVDDDWGRRVMKHHSHDIINFIDTLAKQLAHVIDGALTYQIEKVFEGLKPKTPPPHIRSSLNRIITISSHSKPITNLIIRLEGVKVLVHVCECSLLRYAHPLALRALTHLCCHQNGVGHFVEVGGLAYLSTLLSNPSAISPQLASEACALLAQVTTTTSSPQHLISPKTSPQHLTSQNPSTHHLTSQNPSPHHLTSQNPSPHHLTSPKPSPHHLLSKVTTATSSPHLLSPTSSPHYCQSPTSSPHHLLSKVTIPTSSPHHLLSKVTIPTSSPHHLLSKVTIPTSSPPHLLSATSSTPHLLWSGLKRHHHHLIASLTSLCTSATAHDHFLIYLAALSNLITSPIDGGRLTLTKANPLPPLLHTYKKMEASFRSVFVQEKLLSVIESVVYNMESGGRWQLPPHTTEQLIDFVVSLLGNKSRGDIDKVRGDKDKVRADNDKERGDKIRLRCVGVIQHVASQGGERCRKICEVGAQTRLVELCKKSEERNNSDQLLMACLLALRTISDSSTHDISKTNYSPIATNFSWALTE